MEIPQETNSLTTVAGFENPQNNHLLYIYIYIFFFMGVSKNRGTPKWMVYNGKPYLNG